MGMSLKTHIRLSKEQRRKEMGKVHGWMASYRTAPRTWSTKACAKKLNKKWLLDLCERNETRRTYRAPLTQALPHVLQSFAEAFANALAVRPCRNRTDFCLLAATKRAGGDEGPLCGCPGAKISWSESLYTTLRFIPTTLGLLWVFRWF